MFKMEYSKWKGRLCNICKEDNPIDVKELTIANTSIAMCKNCRNKLVEFLLVERGE